MNLGNNNGATLGHKNRNRDKISPANSARNSNISRFGSILSKSRLTEQDLQRFEQEIIIAHRKRNYQALSVFSIILILMAALVIILIA